MPSVREQAIEALELLIREAAPAATIARNPTAEAEVPADGLIIIRDGDPGDPDEVLSPPRYWFTHDVEVVIHAGGRSAKARATATDTILDRLRAEVDANPTLWGKVEDARVGPPRSEDSDGEGGTPLRGQQVAVTLEYQTDSSAG